MNVELEEMKIIENVRYKKSDNYAKSYNCSLFHKS